MAPFEPSADQRIWQVVAGIPEGRVTTYSEVARQAGVPGAARRVGAVLRALPGHSRLPWHRVVNAQGKLSLAPDTPSGRRQRHRLEAEGVVFSASGSISFEHFFWPQPGD